MVTENPFNEALSENQDKGQLSLFVNYNPDVLNCLANLSSDEVFTPPNIANRMLDLLPKELWSNKDATFLDPFCKSGVFLREIVLRLNEGLKSQIPDEQERFNHILSTQVFGIGITQLTALISRRTVYCTKQANGKLSACTVFKDENGNIFYERLEHRWSNDGKCEECGASRAEYDIISENRENHAYAFIHGNPLALLESRFKELGKEMKFDVIIGNPPYQLNDGGGVGSSAKPIYQLFIQQAKKLNPNHLVMIVPSRWFSGGKGLDEFRDEMLDDNRMKEIHDYPNASECFPGPEIKGGVNYFHWEKAYQGDCTINTYENHKCISSMKRALREKDSDILIRYNEGIEILKKIKKIQEPSFNELISANDPFGFDVRVTGSYRRVKPKFKKEFFEGSVKFYYNGWKREGLGYMEKDKITKNTEWVDKYKILIPKAWGEGDSKTDRLRGFIAEVPSCCTETYLVINPTDNRDECENILTYINTRFFHFMTSLGKITQNTMKKAYQFVPMQDFSKPWTDEELYKKYKLTKKEIAFIEKMVRPME